MMKAFYDSLETLQKVQFATKRDYVNLGLGVLVAIVVFGAFFIGVDTIWSGLYKTFYTGMKGDVSVEQALQNTTALTDEETTGSLLDSVDLSGVQVITDDGTSGGVSVDVE